MRREENDPLPFQLWLAQLGELRAYSESESRENEDRAVRRAFYLFRLATPTVRSFGNPHLTEAEVEQALENSDAEAAMLLVLGQGARCEIAAAPEPSRFRASLAYDDRHITWGEANSPALALVCAWCSWLISPK